MPIIHEGMVQQLSYPMSNVSIYSFYEGRMIMAEAAMKVEGKSKKKILDDLKDILPDGNLSLCLTCGLCSSGCPATGLENMDPRKFLRMLVLGMDDEVLKSDWPWMCTMCQRCVYVCPMKIDIPQLIFNIRAARPRDERPAGIRGSCDAAIKGETLSAMGTPVEDFKFVVQDVLEEYRESQPEFADMEAPIDKVGAEFYLNQNSREPMTEPDEMVPLWKILHLAGANWTYGSKAWAAENYCLFLADDESWETLVRKKAQQTQELGCKTYLNTE
jgi:ferredoxin